VLLLLLLLMMMMMMMMMMTMMMKMMMMMMMIVMLQNVAGYVKLQLQMVQHSMQCSCEPLCICSRAAASHVVLGIFRQLEHSEIRMARCIVLPAAQASARVSLLSMHRNALPSDSDLVLPNFCPCACARSGWSWKGGGGYAAIE